MIDTTSPVATYSLSSDCYSGEIFDNRLYLGGKTILIYLILQLPSCNHSHPSHILQLRVPYTKFESGSLIDTGGGRWISASFWHLDLQNYSLSLVHRGIAHPWYYSNVWQSLLASYLRWIIKDYLGSAHQPLLLRGVGHIPVSYICLTLLGWAQW